MKAVFFAALLLVFPLRAGAVNFWRFPEAADKGTIFIDARFAEISFAEGFLPSLPEIGVDAVLPFFLPFSLGAYFKTPDPNLKSFGARLAYHIDLEDPRTDLYLLYVFDFGFTRNALLREYGDEEQDVRRYDFRAGVRRAFGKFFCLSVETSYKLRGFRIGFSARLNN
jgi:hypothetical protein